MSTAPAVTGHGNRTSCTRAPGRDRDCCVGRDLRQARDVVSQHRLFEPTDVQRLERLGKPDGLLGVVAIVGVDVYRRFVAQRLAYRCDPSDILVLGAAEVPTYLHLRALEPFFSERALLTNELFGRVVCPAAGTVDRHALVCRAEQPVQRDLQRLRLDIPDSVVDGGDGLERGAFPAVAAHPPEHVVPDLLGLEWVCTDYQV
jgi:hypothetical protein